MEMQSNSGHGPTTAAAATAIDTAATFTQRHFNCRLEEAAWPEVWQPLISCESNNSNVNTSSSSNSILPTRNVLPFTRNSITISGGNNTFQCARQTFDEAGQTASYRCDGESPLSEACSLRLKARLMQVPHDAYEQFRLAINEVLSDNASDILSDSLSCGSRVGDENVLQCELGMGREEKPLLCHLQSLQSAQTKPGTPPLTLACWMPIKSSWATCRTASGHSST